MLAAQRLVIRLARTPLRRALELVYLGVAKLSAWYLTRGEHEPAGYLRGGPGAADFWPGLSDLDLVLVLADTESPGRPAERVRERWHRLRTRFPAVGTVLDWPRVHEQSELRGLTGASAFTYGLDERTSGRPAAAAYAGPRASLDAIRVLEHPGLYGESAGWRRLSGPERRTPEPDRDSQERRVAAWLELVYWWRWVAPFCALPLLPRAADLSVKLIAEPARIWLWLAHGARVGSRSEALELALARLPEEEEALRFALELRRRLPDSPDDPLSRALPPALRLSSRIAQLLREQVAGQGATEVRLVGTPSGRSERRSAPAGELPLVDWRAIACAARADETFFLLGNDAADPSRIGEAAATNPSGAYPALRANDLLLLPAVELERSRLRAIKCEAVDPVVFAVLRGADVARFPRVRGWSAEDTARRAIAEHRARLATPTPAADGDTRGPLLAAARAGLFAESIERGEPELCLTADAVAERLVGCGAGAGGELSREQVLGLSAYR